MNTIVTTNRHKDTMKWRALALEYEMKISYLERALAQEESKLRIAEQVADRSTFCCVGRLVRRFIMPIILPLSLNHKHWCSKGRGVLHNLTV